MKGHAAAIAALQARIKQLYIRRDYAKFIGDSEKLADIDKKISRGDALLKKLKRKAR